MTIIPNLFAFFVGIITVLIAFIFIIYLLIYVIRRKNFPKKLLIARFSGITLYAVIVAGTHLFYTFNTIDRNNTQSGPPASTSPNGRYEATATYELYGGAIGGVNVFVDVINLETQDLKTIYYADAVDRVRLEWIDNETLAIWNESVSGNGRDYNAFLNVETDIFHDRGKACWSLLMKRDYERCFSESMKR